MGKKEDKDLLEGFSIVFDNVKKEGDVDPDFPVVDDPEDIDDPNDTTEETIDTEETEDEKNKPKPIVKDDEPDDDIVDDPSTMDDDSVDLTPHFELIGSELFGDDFKVEDLPEGYNSPEGFASWIKEIVEENSKPSYSSQISADFDEYIKNGGDPNRFFSSYVKEEIDYNDVDLSDSDTQKKLVSRLLKNKGFSDKAIQQKLSRYEDSGVLEDEAADAFEILKESEAEEKKSLIEKQKQEAQNLRKQHEKMLTDAATYVKGKKDFNGVPLADKDKEKVLNFVFDRNKDGLTEYQLEYQKDPVSFLLETAMYWKYRDKLMSDVKKQAATDAKTKFKEKLTEATKGKLKGSQGIKGSVDLKALDFFKKLKA